MPTNAPRLSAPGRGAARRRVAPPADADQRAREEIRRVNEDARREVCEAVENARSEVEDANAAAWLATVEPRAGGAVPPWCDSASKSWNQLTKPAASLAAT